MANKEMGDGLEVEDWRDVEDDEYFRVEEEDSMSPVNEFFDAIWFNNISKVEKMMDEGYSATSVSPFDNMAIHYAVLNNKKDVLKLFKEKMAPGEIDVIYVSQSDDTICGTPLHTAVGEQVPVEVLRLLLEWGANVNATDAKGTPVLHHLFEMAWQDFEEGFETEFIDPQTVDFEIRKKGQSYLTKLKMLHDFGADMNVNNEQNGISAFHCWSRNFYWCTETCRDEPVTMEWCKNFLEIYLACGANPDITAERKTSPLFYLAQRRYLSHHTDFMREYRLMVQAVLKHCKNLTICDINGRNILHAAAEYSNSVLLEELLKHKLDVNKGDRFGLAPLHLITHNKTFEERELVISIIKSLTKLGAQINIKDNHGSSPLHHAIHMQNMTAIKYLVDFGASLSVVDNKGLSPIDLASIEGTGEIKELLGIIYDRSAPSIVRGRTDLRFGWFYPLCCHKEYKDDVRYGMVESPEVYYREIDEWLKKFPMCAHNASCILQNSIPTLETNKEQEKLTREDTIEIKRSVLSVLGRVADAMGKIDTLFQCSLVLGGSVSEDTKVGSPDELDVVFNLHEIASSVMIEKSKTKAGFVLLKLMKRTEVMDSKLTDLEDGYIQRSKLSKLFHSLFESCLRQEDVWENSHLYSDWGTTNALGEGMNIGQLHLVWYGPLLKRQDISVDIVPVIKIPGWQPKSLRSNVKIIDEDVIGRAGCYLVMKSTEEKDIPTISIEHGDMAQMSDTEDDSLEHEDKLFRVSHSHLEHAVMSTLPQHIKDGYKVAKSIRLQCPVMLFDLVVFGKSVLPECKTKAEVGQCITSYILKTALFHELHDQEIKSNIKFSELNPETWNERVISYSKDYSIAGQINVPEILDWASRIYSKVSDLCTCVEGNNIPTYFIPASTIKTSSSLKIAIKQYCKIILKLLKDFPVRDTDSVTFN